MLTPEQKKKLETAGYSPEKIASYETLKSGQEPGYLERLGKGYMERAENVISDIKRPAKLMEEGASPLKVAGAVGEAGLRTVGQVAGAAFDPITEALKPVVEPVIQKAAKLPGVKKVVEKGTELAQKYPEAAKDIGAVANIASLPLGGGAGKALKGGISKAASVAEETVAPAGRTLKSAGKGLYGLTTPMDEGTSKALMSYQKNQGSLLNRMRNELMGETAGKPITEADTAARMGLMGTEREIGIQASQAADKIWSRIEPKLAADKTPVNMRQFFTELEDEIAKSTPEISRKHDLLEGLEALKDEYKKVGDVSKLKLQDYKSGWTQLLPAKAWKGKEIGGAFNEVKRIAANKARGIIHESVGKDGVQDFIDWGNLQSIIEAGVKAPTGDAAKRSFGRNVWEAVMDKAVTPIATVAGRVLYKTGDGLEFVGKVGAKKVADVVK